MRADPRIAGRVDAPPIGSVAQWCGWGDCDEPHLWVDGPTDWVKWCSGEAPPAS